MYLKEKQSMKMMFEKTSDPLIFCGKFLQEDIYNLDNYIICKKLYTPKVEKIDFVNILKNFSEEHGLYETVEKFNSLLKVFNLDVSMKLVDKSYPSISSLVKTYTNIDPSDNNNTYVNSDIFENVSVDLVIEGSLFENFDNDLRLPLINLISIFNLVVNKEYFYSEAEPLLENYLAEMRACSLRGKMDYKKVKCVKSKI